MYLEPTQDVRMGKHHKFQFQSATHSLNSSFLSLTSNQSLAVMSSPTREISVKLRCECKCHRMNPHVDAQRSKGSYQRKVASTVVSDTGYLPNNEN